MDKAAKIDWLTKERMRLQVIRVYAQRGDVDEGEGMRS